MKKTISKLMMIIGLLCFAPIVSYAQSASESYNKGVALMNKGDYQEAIASFKASMAINKSAANVKKCNAQIAKCNRLAKKKRSGGEDSSKKAAPSKQLTLSTYTLSFDSGEDIAGKQRLDGECGLRTRELVQARQVDGRQEPPGDLSGYQQHPESSDRHHSHLRPGDAFHQTRTERQQAPYRCDEG